MNIILYKHQKFVAIGVIAYVSASAIAYFTPGVKPINGIIAVALGYLLAICCHAFRLSLYSRNK